MIVGMTNHVPARFIATTLGTGFGAIHSVDAMQ